jgi:dipeptidase D
MNILNHFKTICDIPHCSNEADALKNFLVEFSKERGYETTVDKTKNILVRKGSPKLALQAHYDMVCVGKAPQIELIEEDGYLSAKDSSLGADNGIAIAMMMALMDEGAECEFIFTSDEEVGLIGAGALEYDLKSKYMLNLDSEDEAEVYIGCAGGVDLKAVREFETHSVEGNFYEINISGLPGGHSGVEIHKDIPNAIKLLGEFLKDKPAKVAYIKGGERINSIPTTLRAIVSCDEQISSVDKVDVRRFNARFELMKNSEDILDVINGFKNGVLSFNDELGIPDESINLALIDLYAGVLTIEASARAMDKKGLKKVKNDAKDHFKKYGFEVTSNGKYPAWKPEINQFSQIVYDATKKVFGKSEYKAIHAGLECAIISDLYPDIKIASIGPNITSPHSTHESVELESINRVYKVVKEVVKRLETV